MAMFFLIVAIITIPIALYGLMLSIVLLIEQEAEKAEMVRKIKEDNDREIYLYLKSIGHPERFFAR